VQLIDADINLAGNQAFTFIGGGLFSFTAGELRFDHEILSGDTSGNGIADFEVYLAGVSSLYEGDFLL
jgi:serralysin